MKRVPTRIVPFLILLLAPVLAAGQQPGFVPNEGQWDGDFSHALFSRGYGLYVEHSGWTVDAWSPPHHHHGQEEEGEHEINGSFAYRQHFVGCNPSPLWEQGAQNPTPLNYLLGNNPARWATGLKASNQVISKHFYPGIHLVIDRQAEGFEYTFHVDPGAAPQYIAWEYEGLEPVLTEGRLVLTTPVATITEMAPKAWQVIGGERREVRVAFRLENNRVRFELGPYNKREALIIDPVVVFSSLTGSTSDNWGFTATYDDDGHLYAGGIVFTGQYPVTPGVFQPNSGGLVDISLMKFSPDGTAALYSTFLGGDRREVPTSMVVDPAGNLVLLATAASTNLYTSPGAFASTHQGGFNFGGSQGPTSLLFVGGTDLYLTRISPSGNQLIAATYLGGAGNEGLNPGLIQNYGDVFRGEVVTDANGNILVTSTTTSNNFPVFNAAQNANAGASDAVVLSINPALTTLNWSTYFGGSANDAGFSLKAAANGSVYAGGSTISSNLPQTGGGHTTTAPGGKNGFLVRINAASGVLQQATYVGTSAADALYLLDVDRFNNVYCVGQTEGSVSISTGSLGTPGARQFVKKFNPTLTTELLSTALGSGPNKFDLVPTAFLVDDCLRIFISGWNGTSNIGEEFTGNTNSLPTTTGAFQATSDGSDFYMATYSRDFKALEYATYFGGSSYEHVDGGTSRFSKEGIIYQAICAACGTGSFPTTPGVYGPVDNSTNCNLGAVKIDFQTAVIAESSIDFQVDVDTSCYGLTVTFSNQSVNAQVFQWDFGNGDTSNAFAPTAVFDSLGTYTITLIAIDTICNISDTSTLELVHDRPEKPEASFVPDYESCDLLFEARFDNTTLGGDTYAWDFGDGGTATGFSPTHVFPGYGAYTITMIATDTLCFTTDTAYATVVFLDSVPVPAFSIVPNFCNDGTIDTELNEGRTRYLYSWSLSTGGTASGPNPLLPVPGNGTYQVNLVITDTLCNRQYTLQSDADIEIRPEILFIPNAFTPNSDGINEFWEIKGNTCSEDTHLWVFNKWGQEVFYTTKPLEVFWNGKFQGRYAPQDVYVWRLQDGERISTGTVMLVY